MRWPWRRYPEVRAASEESQRRRDAVRGRWPEIRETIGELREALHSATGDDPFVESVRREFGRQA